MSRQKFQYIRSKRLLEACRELPCQNCGRSDGTVCAAHSNQAIHGKGRGIKASDIYVAALCHECHMMIDQGPRDRAAKEELWSWAHQWTVRELVRRSLWPVTVPIPIVERLADREAVTA